MHQSVATTCMYNKELMLLLHLCVHALSCRWLCADLSANMASKMGRAQEVCIGNGCLKAMFAVALLILGAELVSSTGWLDCACSIPFAFLGVTVGCFAAPSRLPGFVSAGIQTQSQPDKAAGKAKPASMAANPEEMELEEIDEEAEEQAGAQQVEEEDAEAAGMSHEVQLQQKAVPAAVFGGAWESEHGTDAQQQPPALGALDRFKKRKTLL